jgi:diketogulonate reductase-like aldo/keto reductase
MIPDIKLNDGHKIPQIGLGLWQVKSDQEFNTAFDAAIKVGYRHFDSAQEYDNEHLLGAAWQRLGLKRQDIFITTKISVTHFGAKRTASSFAQSIVKLKTDYVDLLLLHFPVTGLRQKSWPILEQLQTSNKVLSIGVSNYTIRHLEEMKTYAKVTPAVNQIELHLFLQQPDLIKYCQDNQIVVEAYSPLAHAKQMDNPAINEIAKRRGKTYAQIMLRWCVQLGLVVLPKSVTPERIKENFAIFDFELTADDMKLLAKQDEDLRTCWSPVHVP